MAIHLMVAGENMKVGIFILTCVLSITAFADCPDFSGRYLQGPQSCTGSLKNTHPWPLVEQPESTTVTISQNGCDEIRFHYLETRYSNLPERVESVDLRKADKLKIKSESILEVTYKQSLERLDTMFGVAHLADRTHYKFQINEDGSFSMRLRSLMTGTYHYIVPVVDLDVINCDLRRL
jgi:hypothetical protein